MSTVNWRAVLMGNDTDLFYDLRHSWSHEDQERFGFETFDGMADFVALQGPEISDRVSQAWIIFRSCLGTEVTESPEFVGIEERMFPEDLWACGNALWALLETPGRTGLVNALESLLDYAEFSELIDENSDWLCRITASLAGYDAEAVQTRVIEALAMSRE